jgi:hypothetical protein
MLDADIEVPLPPMALWERLTAPAERARWEGLEAIEDVGGTRRGIGTVTACVVDRLETVEEIVDWRPFDAFVRTARLPGGRRLTTCHELEPGGDGDGTRLRVRWWGSPPTATHAERERDRLLQLAR